MLFAGRSSSASIRDSWGGIKSKKTAILFTWHLAGLMYLTRDGNIWLLVLCLMYFFLTTNSFVAGCAYRSNHRRLSGRYPLFVCSGICHYNALVRPCFSIRSTVRSGGFLTLWLTDNTKPLSIHPQVSLANCWILAYGSICVRLRAAFDNTITAIAVEAKLYCSHCDFIDLELAQKKGHESLWSHRLYIFAQ